MKALLAALVFATFLAVASFGAPAPATAQDVKALCNNKHGLGNRWPSAGEAERKKAAARIAACIRSGGKS